MAAFTKAVNPTLNPTHSVVIMHAQATSTRSAVHAVIHECDAVTKHYALQIIYHLRMR